MQCTRLLERPAFFARTVCDTRQRTRAHVTRGKNVNDISRVSLGGKKNISYEWTDVSDVRDVSGTARLRVSIAVGQRVLEREI